MLNSPTPLIDILFKDRLGPFTTYLKYQKTKNQGEKEKATVLEPKRSILIKETLEKEEKETEQKYLPQINEAAYILAKANIAMKRIVGNINNYKAPTQQLGLESCKTDFHRTLWKIFILYQNSPCQIIEHMGNPLNFNPEDFYIILQDNLLRTGMSVKLARFIALYTNQAGALQWPAWLLAPLQSLIKEVRYIPTFCHNTVEVYVEHTENYVAPHFISAINQATVIVKLGIDFFELETNEFVFKDDPLQAIYFVNKYVFSSAPSHTNEPAIKYATSWLEFPSHPSQEKLSANLCLTKLKTINTLLEQEALDNKYALYILGYFIDLLANILDNPSAYKFLSNYEINRNKVKE